MARNKLEKFRLYYEDLPSETKRKLKLSKLFKKKAKQSAISKFRIYYEDIPGYKKGWWRNVVRHK